ncbi:penicillin-binding protein 2 [Bryobacter aggregatus]|uniref:penicillin-binding protein 2 n=1 Tax=Bryobacter aggregatus TaxID=360054 RepID=UPI000690846A|nr:penicillin-binding protein 2 [Bryobacter aggregatus]
MRFLRDESKFAQGKIAVLQYFTVAVFVFILGGYWNLQIRNEELYSSKAERNRIKSLPMPAPRGKILDRDKRVIVDNHSSFSVLLSRETLRDEHLQPIAEGLGLDYEELVARLKRFRARPKYQAVIIKEELTPSDIAFVESHRDPDTYPEMELIHTEKRVYPASGFAAHMIGYVGEVSEAELNQADFAKYQQGDMVGKTGLERQYNDLLTGVDGQRQVLVDNIGNERRILGMKPAVAGQNIELTVDLDVQTVMELAMDGRRGGAIALDPRNGEVLAMTSKPSFDLSKLSSRERTKEWRDIFSNPDKPLLNRAIQAQLSPGSTFKPFVALAALEAGTVDEHTSFTCTGGMTFAGRYFRCHNRHGHGPTSLKKALAQSCDVYFYNVGARLGIDRISALGEIAGLGQKTGIDLPAEAEAMLPSSRWKIRNLREKWHEGDTVNVAIGQGYLTMTPIQLAYGIGGIVMGGVWHTPHLLRNGDAPKKPAHQAELNLDHVRTVMDGMCDVVNGGGTAGSARLPGGEMCGKTGTAQTASNEYQKAKGIHLKDNAWFIAFAPRVNPEIVVAVLFEEGEHGPQAGTIARDIVKAYFDKKVRKEVSQTGVPAVTASAPADAANAPARVAN